MEVRVWAKEDFLLLRGDLVGEHPAKNQWTQIHEPQWDAPACAEGAGRSDR